MKLFLTCLTFFVLATFLLVFVVGEDGGDIENHDGSRFQFAGHSGELKIRTVTGVKIKVKFNRLTEVNGTKPIASTQVKLEDGTYSFITPVTTVFPGTTIPVLTTGFTTSIPITPCNMEGDSISDVPIGSVNFTVTVYRFNSSATVPNGLGNIVTVGANDVKFSVSLSSWPFASVGNKLRLSFKTEVEGSDDDSKHNGDDKQITKKDDGKNEASVPFAGNKGRFDLAVVANADGVNQPVTISPIRADGEGGIAVYLPYYTSSLNYDPTLSSQPVASTSTATVVTLSFTTLALIVFAHLGFRL